MVFNDFAEITSFCHYVEEETDYFQISFLGYPWYIAAKESLYNSVGGTKWATPTNEPKFDPQPRQADFQAKLPILEEALNKQEIEYVFIMKSKMRRKGEHRIENELFLDVFNYLEQRGKRFLIFEQAQKDADFDYQYLQSKFASITIPYEYLVPSFDSQLGTFIAEAKQEYEQLIMKRFAEVGRDEVHFEKVQKLKGAYLALAGLIGHVIVNKMLLAQMGVKALFGGMGTQWYAGYDNKFCAIEIDHGLNKVLNSIDPPHERVVAYSRDHVALHKAFCLTLSAEDTLPPIYYPLLEQNRFNYGVPEFRAYLKDEPHVEEIRERYSLGEKPSILIVSSQFMDYAELEKLIRALRNRVPELNILIRPHPTYENASHHAGYSDLIHLVSSEHKYDLMSLADVVLSPPSTMVVEAHLFTDNILVFPNAASPDLKGLVERQCYPYADFVELQDTSLIVDKVEALLKSRPRGALRKPVREIEGELDRLFSQIEASFDQS